MFGALALQHVHSDTDGGQLRNGAGIAGYCFFCRLLDVLENGLNIRQLVAGVLRRLLELLKLFRGSSKLPGGLADVQEMAIQLFYPVGGIFAKLCKYFLRVFEFVVCLLEIFVDGFRALLDLGRGLRRAFFTASASSSIECAVLLAAPLISPATFLARSPAFFILLLRLFELL